MAVDLHGKKIHMLGICGTGMSALAGLLKEKGALISGSDTQFYPPIGPMLTRLGVKAFDGYDPSRIDPQTELFIVGNVVGRGNPEVEWLLNSRRPYESMAEALYRLVMAERTPVVIAGTHGKTTTTAFLAHLFSVCRKDPGYFIAGNPLDLETSHRLGTGKWFFAEGDEYETAFFDRASKFLRYRPKDLILTALEHDHVDFFPDPLLYQKSFANLINTVPGDGVIICNRDYEMARQVISGAFSRTITYGFEAGADVIIGVDAVDADGMDFTIPWQGHDHRFRTPLMGRYNLLNLCAGILYGFTQGLEAGTMAEAVSGFHGVERRMTRLGQQGNTLFFEDFAHHPTAITQVIGAVRQSFPAKKILTVLEPRSWSLRRSRFSEDLKGALGCSDEAWISEIYQKEKLTAGERLDVKRLADDLQRAGLAASRAEDAVEIWARLQSLDFTEQRVVLILSNGAFGGLAQQIRDLCGTRSPA
jgi:UDP-N-acetylmuramate: L-alanyl-gamma-D-glutamyl-meso-diaminopimelate ligase